MHDSIELNDGGYYRGFIVVGKPRVSQLKLVTGDNIQTYYRQ